jgi:hypothetical protein
MKIIGGIICIGALVHAVLFSIAAFIGMIAIIIENVF